MPGLTGELFVTGTTSGTITHPANSETNSGGDDGFLIKFDENLSPQWVRLFGTSSRDAATDVIHESHPRDGSLDDGIIVTGNTAGSFPGFSLQGASDMYLAKYDDNGTRLWLKQLEAAGAQTDEYWQHSLTTQGNQRSCLYGDPNNCTGETNRIYRTGSSSGHNGIFDGGTSYANKDHYVVKYDTNGNKIWTRLFGFTNASLTPADIMAFNAGGRMRTKSIANYTGTDIHIAGTTDGDMNGKHGLGGKDAYYIRFDAADNMSHDPFAGFDDISFALDSRPLAPVTVHLSSDNTSEFVVTPRTLTFTSSNWNVAQSILVFNVLDNASDGDKIVNLNFSTSSTDSNYNNYSIPPVAVTVVDSDLPRLSLSASATSVVEGDNITLTYTLTKPTSPILGPVDPAGSPLYHSSRQSTIDGYSRTLIKLQNNHRTTSSSSWTQGHHCDYSASPPGAAQTAELFNDYTISSGYSGLAKVYVEAGQTTGTDNLSTVDDDIYEGDEKIILCVEGVSPGGYAVIDNGSQQLTITIIDDELPAPVLDNATPASGQNTVNRQSVAKAISYTLNWKTSSGENTAEDNITITDNSSTSYVHTGLDNGTRYYYKLVANRASKSPSAISNEVNAVTHGTTPTPDNLTATAGAGQNTISWNALSGADNYTLYYSTSSPAHPGGTQISISGSSTSYTHTSLDNGSPLTPYTTYYYQLVGNNSFGSSSPSSAASATPTNSLTCTQTSRATGTPASG